MPPKKKGTGKKSAKAQSPPLVDGLPKDEMSKEQLKEHIVRLREELDRVREEKIYFRVERDKMQTFKDVADRKLEETQANLNKLNKDIEDDASRHKVEIEVYKQKMKHLLCEHQNTICEKEADAAASAGAMKEGQDKIEAKLHQELKTLSMDVGELDAEVLRMQRELSDEELVQRGVFLYGVVKDLTWLEDSRRSLINEKINLRAEEEDCWSFHYCYLMDDLTNAFADTDAATSYFQEITDSNIAFQKMLKDGIKEMSEKTVALARVTHDNKRLDKLVKEADAKKANLKYRLEQQAKLYAKSSAGTSLKKQIISQKAENEALEREIGKLELERDELRDAMAQTLARMQHEADVRVAEREEKIRALTELLEQTDARLRSMLSASNIDQTALAELMKECKEKVDSYNRIINDLKGKKAMAAESLLLRPWQAKRL